MSEYNGYKNRQTWSVVNEILNDEGLYNCAVDFMDKNSGCKHPYIKFIKEMGLDREKNIDGYLWDSNKLDYVELNEMMWGL